MLLYHSLAVGLGLVASSRAIGGASDLTGTWSTKSNKTLTGPGFYDPLNDKFIEPERTGISYSFTAEGYFEEAYYRAIANPQNPKCPSAIMQWQHGTWTYNANGSLTMEPIAVDGRQLLSKPCDYDKGIYTRYNQSELFRNYEVVTDAYHNIPRLNLFEFDGTPMQPLYLVRSPPEMLPTTTLNPTNTGTAAGGSKATSKAKAKRGLDYPEVPLNWKAKYEQGMIGGSDMVQRINADRLWWIGLTFTGIGGLLYFGPRRLGLRL
ncbi:Protein ROT1 [Pseudocercospora fuligena]|uniref:Protein ROT1 n=1 Tax=Pseudocercospora fuligena TaxID=685502 RepID=A0A8H6RWP6_9PEZI|nr:Protein ROT1 [Pseudocercospora fuligena]